jgi:hypothetical protein
MEGGWAGVARLGRLDRITEKNQMGIDFQISTNLEI